MSGALLAAEKKQTLVTFLFFAVVTGIGGGTVRDLLIGAPVFWVRENWTLLICFGAALAVWLLPARLWKGRALLWLDAAGLAAFSAYGAAKGLAFDLAPIPAIAMGVLTGCLGGIIRDVLAGEPSILMRPRALRHRRRSVGGAARRPDPGGRAGRRRRPRRRRAGFALRGAAIWRGWSLPAYGAEYAKRPARRIRRLPSI